MTELVANDEVVLDASGDQGTFTGTLVDGLPHGDNSAGCEMIYDDGRRYVGAFRMGRWHGRGLAKFPNGDVYDGEYSLDQRHGKGHYIWSDGRSYQGEFAQDLRHGQGRYSWPDGALYDGEFWEGQRHGQGEYRFPGGRYNGGFKNGLYHGYGECVWYEDGRTYRGEWKKGKAHGQGVETDAHGNILHQGEWQQDEAVVAENVRQDAATTTTTVGSNGGRAKTNMLTNPEAVAAASLRPVVNQLVWDARGRSGTFRGMVVRGVPHGVGHMEYDPKSVREITSYQGFWQMGEWQEGRVDYTNGDTYHGHFESTTGKRTGEGEYHWCDGRHYKGEWKNDLRHGKGRFLYPNGDLFDGHFVEGVRQGLGRFEFADGTLFEGSFVSGQFGGNLCKYVHRDGRVYLGDFVGGVRSGHGKETYPDGSLRYEGEWVDDEPLHPNKIQPAPSGFVMQLDEADVEHTAPVTKTESPVAAAKTTAATPASTNTLVKETENCKTVVEYALTDAQGNPGTFTGLVLNELPHGVGRMVYTGEIREGFWKHGFLEGHARAFFSNGDFYEGNFSDSQREGKGVYKWKDGRIYEGDYSNDMRHGHGRFVYPSGDEYVGGYQEGQRVGQGKFTFADGSSYDGEWKNSQYHGQGVLNEVSGRCYRGEWSYGKRCGKGTETVHGLRGTKIRKGEWLDDVLVEEEAETPRRSLRVDEAAHPVTRGGDALDWGSFDGENKRWEEAASGNGSSGLTATKDEDWCEVAE